jgi:ubiquinone/menaquinone biosynthesis C-methylase UbiE
MSFSGSIDRSWLYTILACPWCFADLLVTRGMLRCSRCPAEFKQVSDLWVNLYPEKSSKNDTDEWEHRQEEMEGWYRDLISDRQRAAGCFHFDYSPYAALLRGLTGGVLDLGGGIGVTRHFLAAATHYVVLDPSLDWLSADWTALGEEFPCLLSFPCFIRGVGEQLPFHNGSFNAVVALWSLNHVRDPAAVLSEVHRVLVPGGRFIVTLEDMIPSWRDALMPARRFAGETRWHALMPSRRFAYGARWPDRFVRKAYLTASRRAWPLQSDHLRILERDIRTWINERFKVKRREWIGQYLTFEFERP